MSLGQFTREGRVDRRLLVGRSLIPDEVGHRKTNSAEISPGGELTETNLQSRDFASPALSKKAAHMTTFFF